MNDEARATVIGGRGFIGSHLVRALERRGVDVWVPQQDDDDLFSRDLGDVYYAAGVTSDFRSRLGDMIEAHCAVLEHVLQRARFRSLLYFSSTRIYRLSPTTAPDSPVVVEPLDVDESYALSKLLGESLCLRDKRGTVRVMRVSNVLGEDYRSGNFVFALIDEALRTGTVRLQTTLDSAKDYVWIDDVVKAAMNISAHGRSRIYNVASGRNVTNEEILRAVCEATGAGYEVASNAARVTFPAIDMDGFAEEFGWQPVVVTARIGQLVAGRRAHA